MRVASRPAHREPGRLGLAASYVLGVVPHFPAAPGHHWGPFVQAASAGGWSQHLWAGLGILIAPPSEEFVFRGVLFTGFLKRWSALTAGALVTLLFLLGHLTEVWGYAPALVATIVLGVATLFARILTNSLAPAVALHAAYNLLLVVTSYVGTRGADDRPAMPLETNMLGQDRCMLTEQASNGPLSDRDEPPQAEGTHRVAATAPSSKRRCPLGFDRSSAALVHPLPSLRP